MAQANAASTTRRNVLKSIPACGMAAIVVPMVDPISAQERVLFLKYREACKRMWREHENVIARSGALFFPPRPEDKAYWDARHESEVAHGNMVSLFADPTIDA